MKTPFLRRLLLSFAFLPLLAVYAIACSAPQTPVSTPRATATNIPATPTNAPPKSPSPRGAAQIATDLDAFFVSFRKTIPFSGVVLVARNGETLYEKSFGETSSTPPKPLTSTSKFRIASVSKQFTAAAILRLQADGKLNVQDNVCKHLKQCPKSWEGITLHQLLTHTSGIPGEYTSPAEKDFDAKYHTPQELVALYGELPLEFKPGTRFSYGNGGYIALAAIIEQVSGENYETYLRKNFLDSLEMQDTGTVIADTELSGEPLPFDVSNAVGAGNLYSTEQDLYRWAKALESWQQNPGSEYQQMFQAQTPPDVDGSRYGYGLRIEKLGDQLQIGHGGLASDDGSAGYGALVVWYPESGLTIIILSNRPFAPDDLGPSLARIALGIP